MSKITIKKIQKVAKDFLTKMGFESRADVTEQNGTIIINLKPENPSLLIGYHGETINAVQHILRLMMTKAAGYQMKLVVDVSDYKIKKQEYLINLVRRIAQKVIQTNRLEILRPMSSYERKMIHLALSEIKGVATESVGEEPNRRIMIKPKKS